MDEDLEDSKATRFETIIEDQLPDCDCGGKTMFLGHEYPDGKWVKSLKAWFKCQVCSKVFPVKLEKPLNIILSTRK